MINRLFLRETCDNEALQHISKIKNSANSQIVFGDVLGSGEAHIVSQIIEKYNKQCLVITANDNRAKQLSEDINFFTDKKAYYMSGQVPFFFKYDAKSHSLLEKRLEIIAKVLGGETCILVCSVEAAMKKMIPKNSFIKNILFLKVGDQLDLGHFLETLVSLGYERSREIESRGQYSLRGGIIDIFVMGSDYPYRIELFDVEIDSIRKFDLDSHRSIENLGEISIFPAQEFLVEDKEIHKGKKIIEKIYNKQASRLQETSKARLIDRKNKFLQSLEARDNMQIFENYIQYFYEENELLKDYMEKGSLLIIEDPARIEEKIGAMHKELTEDFQYLLEKGETVPEDFNIIYDSHDFRKMYQSTTTFFFMPFMKPLEGFTYAYNKDIQTKSIPNFQGRMDLFEREIKTYIAEKYKIFIICSTEERVNNLKNFFMIHNIEDILLYYSHVESMKPGQIVIGKGNLSQGFAYTKDKIVIISDKDIFGHSKSKKTPKRAKDQKQIKVFSDLNVGDYVVHEDHGIGKYLGVEQLKVQNIKRDYIKIKYAGEDMLYVPVEQLNLVQKYIGSDTYHPKINKMGGAEWKRVKGKVEGAIKEMAKELLELNAIRNAEKGFAFSKDTEWQKQFEDAFEYEETTDQLLCTEEIKRDMEKNIPMDRLLCGDVGYGKTEVAMRVIFKCISDSKQAAVLVPTTILANQHYNTFKNRFKDFPITIEMLSRFKTESEQQKIIKKVKEGSVDILIGTHRLFSKDVAFKNLGLLIVDEEQKFGVQHKEAIKMIKKHVDVLTLSATPIPRTLHMSLIGLREMSVIQEPPEERFPVQTLVVEYEEDIIREAILREIERGGQVFFLFNRVKGIRRIAARLQEFIPEISVAVAHGQMKEKELEDIVIDFIEKKYNVLVCTTIIESGIDMPNVNTIIIYDADKFGLSQLYQLRGRVGRSNRMAYAYFVYQKDKILTEQSEKRLRAIKEFTEFGSGFKIAMRDLEIRGAGNLLGTEQHGHMAMIGYELYCKLLEETVQELQGRKINRLTTEVSIEITIDAYIPKNYIEDEFTRIEMYKKIAYIDNMERAKEVEDELIDRFGDLRPEVYNLMDIAYIKSMAEILGISRVSELRGALLFEFHEKNALTPFKISRLIEKYKTRIALSGSIRPAIKYIHKASEDRVKSIIVLLQQLMHEEPTA